MIGNKFDYSIELARKIYTEIATDSEAIEVVKKSIETYFSERNIEYTKTFVKQQYLSNIVYEGGGQTITFSILKGKPESICLNQYEHDSQNLIEKAYYEKVLFGLPVFTLTVMMDSSYAAIHLMSRETYLSFDTPEEQAFRWKMNALDELISRYGGENCNY